MSRSKKRKVKITVKSRDPKDHLEWLEALEKVFQPEEVEICKPDDHETVQAKDTTQTLAEEQLEQEVVEDARKRLDELEDLAKTAKTSPRQKKRKGKKSKGKNAVVTKRQSIQTWLKNFFKAGYKLTVKAIVEAALGK